MNEPVRKEIAMSQLLWFPVVSNLTGGELIQYFFSQNRAIIGRDVLLCKFLRNYQLGRILSEHLSKLISPKQGFFGERSLTHTEACLLLLHFKKSILIWTLCLVSKDLNSLLLNNDKFFAKTLTYNC